MIETPYIPASALVIESSASHVTVSTGSDTELGTAAILLADAGIAFEPVKFDDSRYQYLQCAKPSDVTGAEFVTTVSRAIASEFFFVWGYAAVGTPTRAHTHSYERVYRPHGPDSPRGFMAVDRTDDALVLWCFDTSSRVEAMATEIADHTSDKNLIVVRDGDGEAVACRTEFPPDLSDHLLKKWADAKRRVLTYGVATDIE